MTVLPEKTCQYASAEYWDQRFKEEEEREWCQQYEDFKHLLQPLLKPTDLILIVGCGNSKLGELQSTQQMQWICCNMLNLPFRINTFDVIIEKGTLDVWFTEDSAWNVSARAQLRMQNTLDEIFNCLKIGGNFVSITFSDPYFRMKYYQNQRYDWIAQSQRFGNDFHYYFYAMAKSSNQIGTYKIQFQQQQSDANNFCDIEPMHEYMDEEDYMLKISDELMD
eukprot:TRINITY_DN8848_c1_g1_i2.p1 TRINITY_DN8848_c1_g1~~TRINITY_DN8848_c1_g1_i2.p1  ORF type:complete len:222 (-),score=21.31 TRINITY_DN8848_c1_g1_i2:55-720(-)